jgi:uracil-DNA glycosylase
MKLPELKAELKKRGLPTTGKKEELIKRLLATPAEASNAKEANASDKDNEEVNEEEEPKKVAKGKRKLEDETSTNKEEGSSAKREKLANVASDDILAHLTDDGWKEVLGDEFSKPYFKEILSFLGQEINSGKEIFPPRNEIFAALNYTPIDNVKVVILGQDPYHDNNQANGLCFSVRDGITHPPSLKNIFKELVTDIPGFTVPKSGSLEKWAHRGVLLLNATLTVQAHSANSHAKSGWLEFTDSIIKVLNKKTKGVVFILWGGFAQKKGKIIDRNKHFVIQAAHPSPLSANKFHGCKVFSKTNAILTKEGYDPVDWTL